MGEVVAVSDHKEFTSLLCRALTIPLVLLMIILGTLLWATHHLTGSMQAADRSDRIIGETEDVLRMAVEMEAGVREYLATGKQEFLKSYLASDDGIDSELWDVQQLASDNDTGARLESIRTALSEWRIYSQTVVRLRQEGGDFAAFEANSKEKLEIDAVRKGCESLIAMHGRVHEERVRRATVATNVVIVSCVMLAFALLVVTGSLTIRQVRSLDRVFQESHLARLAAEQSAQRLSHAYQAGKMWSCQVDLETLRIRRSKESVRSDDDAEFLEEDLSAWYARLHPEDRERVREEISAVIAGRSDYEAAFRVLSNDGMYRWTYSRGSRVMLPGGTAAISGVAMDFTEEKRKEETLRWMAQLLELTYEPILVRDLEDRIVYWNGGAQRLYGWSSAEAVGRFSHELLGSKFPEDYIKIVAEFQSTGQWQGEVIHTARNGEKLVIASRWTLQKGEDGRRSVILETNFDLTERKRSEQILVRSDKLASVGRMAATIAHEINNPLAAAMNAVFLASMDASLSSMAQRNLDVAEQELERVAHIAKQTLSFYKETAKPTELKLPELMDGLLDLFGPKLRNKSIQVERRYSTTMTVVGIEGEMRQVLSNLVSNSIDAMPENGTLQVRIGGPVHLNYREMLHLTVADSGIGVDAKDLKHIFEPFFTTKETIGTGLGLWVTRELINKHNGRIRVRSRLGEGTVFTIWLPTNRQPERLSATA